MKLKCKLKVLLAEKDMTNNDLAAAVNVGKSVVSNWVNDRNTPTVAKLFEIASVLDCRVDDIYQYTE